MNIHSAVSEILSGGCRDLCVEKVEMSERAPACEKCIVWESERAELTSGSKDQPQTHITREISTTEFLKCHKVLDYITLCQYEHHTQTHISNIITREIGTTRL